MELVQVLHCALIVWSVSDAALVLFPDVLDTTEVNLRDGARVPFSVPSLLSLRFMSCLCTASPLDLLWH